ncbi:MAG: alpha-amylase [Acidobacteriaceae bacterium]|nr:alpha-amylase [Acidobacteriaceae bacterium]
MPKWPNQPWIYEINAWTWLSALSSRYRRKITLGNLPGEIWDELARTHMDGVWLMGVWRRSATGRKISLADSNVQAECRQLFGEFSPRHVSGSPYCIADYSVDGELGGPEGLAEARRQLATRGLRLLLDFVPNHVAPDHPWTEDHPEYFVQGDRREYEQHPEAFFFVGKNTLARGRDPYFPPWPDTVQLNVFNPGLRSAALATLKQIATQCDGVRCDMAMLLLNRIFAQTWGHRAGSLPASEYWQCVIPQIRQLYPDFIFVAEAYWDLEWELMQQGFDYCYDKRLYDRLVEGNPQGIRAHLSASLDYQRCLIRFLENHDEPRAAAVFSATQNRVAAVALMTLPGAKLLHDGQMSGSKIKLSVHLGQCPDEKPDEELRRFYERLLELACKLEIDRGEWQLCEQWGWPDNESFQNLVSWCWRLGDAKYLQVLNLSKSRSQARIKVPWNDLAHHDWNLRDPLQILDYGRRTGSDLAASGIYVDLEGHSFHFLEFVPEK